MEKKKKAEERLKAYFMKKVRGGVVLGTAELKAYLKRAGLNVSWKYLEKLRRQFKASAIFERIKGRPPAYMTNSIPRFGQVQVDLAFYQERWARFNKGYKGRYKIGGVE